MMSAPLLALALLFPAQDDDAAIKALEIFKSSIRTQEESARAAAVTELAKVPHKKTVSQVAARVLSDGKAVRIAAAKGLAAFSDHTKRVVPMLAKGLLVNKKEPEVQVAILETLGTLGDPAALPAVHREFQAKDARVCAAAFKAAGGIANVRSIDAILKEFRKLEAAANQGGAGINTGGLVPGGGGGGFNVPTDANSRRRAQMALPEVKAALKAITNESFNQSKDAELWWRANRGSFKK